MKIAMPTAYRGLCLATLVLPLLGLGGCATLNENECRTMDWQTIGYEDGGRGHGAERIGQHRKACAKYGIATAYQRGRESGLREYCRPANGFRAGAAGRNYGGVCPADLEEDFLDAYESGHHLYELRARVSEIESHIGSKHDELEHAEKTLAQTSATIIASDSTPERRAQALIDAKHLAEDIGRLKSEIEHLEADLAVSQRDVDSYRATLRYAD
jgi:hypothetical protein